MMADKKLEEVFPDLAAEENPYTAYSVPDCRDCRWCYRHRAGRVFDGCLYPPFYERRAPAGCYLVALNLRSDPDYCGVVGRHFEQRPLGLFRRLLKRMF